MSVLSLRLLNDLAQDKLGLIQWCMAKGYITASYECPLCRGPMNFVRRSSLKDGYEFKCKARRENVSEHSLSRSIRSGSWFSNSKLSFHQVLVITYMWVAKMNCIKEEAGVTDKVVSDWTRFW